MNINSIADLAKEVTRSMELLTQIAQLVISARTELVKVKYRLDELEHEIAEIKRHGKTH